LETSSKIQNGDLLEVSFKEEKVKYFDEVKFIFVEVCATCL